MSKYTTYLFEENGKTYTKSIMWYCWEVLLAGAFFSAAAFLTGAFLATVFVTAAALDTTYLFEENGKTYTKSIMWYCWEVLPMDLEDMGKRIRMKRISRSMSQEELAEKTNLSVPYIGMQTVN